MLGSVSSKAKGKAVSASREGRGTQGPPWILVSPLQKLTAILEFQREHLLELCWEGSRLLLHFQSLKLKEEHELADRSSRAGCKWEQL